MAKTAFPPGAVVLIDGEVRARVMAWWPEGTTTHLHPHYHLQVGSDPTYWAVGPDRVGVRPYKAPAPSQHPTPSPGQSRVL